MNKNKEFVVIGYINEQVEGQTIPKWGAAIVSQKTELPPFGEIQPYHIERYLDFSAGSSDLEMELYTLPLPLPVNNYPMLFAPEQAPSAHHVIRDSLPLNMAVPDYIEEHSRQYDTPITLAQWIQAKGNLSIKVMPNQDAWFEASFEGLIPNSLYTVMALREQDLNPSSPTRPGPLGVPNAFITDDKGCAEYKRLMKTPFCRTTGKKNKIINIVILFMSSQSCHGGAIGIHGLGGDIHAQLKLKNHLELKSGDSNADY
ncbi:hypothetical protein [Microbulbifer sp. 2205BS26-8]|uniref:hypothetical protein n=1 Tax=Microbulbifer sp. 2205BS26-8 TaxID=3064386 RepID=UPI00273DA3A0|nr:hypothetical protein [Microbulbifer sp. 2205BS26-8]MDP5211008.1 hypothetical protein [Microbulbifer sp. 2205BS26-8]